MKKPKPERKKRGSASANPQKRKIVITPQAMTSYDIITFGVSESGHPPMEGSFESDEIVWQDEPLVGYWLNRKAYALIGKRAMKAAEARWQRERKQKEGRGCSPRN